MLWLLNGFSMLIAYVVGIAAAEAFYSQGKMFAIGLLVLFVGMLLTLVKDK